MKFAVVNLGCRVNRAESDFIVNHLINDNEQVDFHDADVIYVNTCTVTSVAEKKTRKTVRHVLTENKNAEVIVTGCAAEIAHDYFKKLDPRCRVINKFELFEQLKDSERGEESQQARVNVKIQDGCNNACTFCIVHVARGKSHSIPMRDVVSECKELDTQGIREIVLTGINLGNYSDPSLAELLRQLLAETSGCRYRISSIEPPEVTDELLEVIKSADWRVCHHFHLPMQSGSSEILKAMDRHYSAEDFKALCDKIYNLMPDYSLTSDIIVGFPGETDAQFQETLNMAKAVRFTKCHVFPYSKRENTPAATMPNQVPELVKKSRAKKLRELASNLSKSEYLKRVGKEEWVVTEGEGRAMTDSYFPIKIEEFSQPGELIKVELTKEMFDDKG